jgi:SpoVK/Ycf46/Vps4 family AAA+-type ATPase
MAIIPRFAAEVRLHMLTTFGITGSEGRPQILLIYGAPGSGKTFQLNECLRAYKIEPVVFDSAEVEHGTAGEPINMLKSKIEKVCYQNSRGTPSALILDDVDLLLGRFAGTQYTHNLQHIIQELMRVAVGIADTTGAPERVPMFFLANDVVNLHLPLLRLGRARFFHWMPTLQEMAVIVQKIIPGLSCEESATLVETFPGELPAFYQDLKDLISRNAVLQLYSHQDFAELLQSLSNIPIVNSVHIGYTLADLISIGQLLRQERFIGLAQAANGLFSSGQVAYQPGGLGPVDLQSLWRNLR